MIDSTFFSYLNLDHRQDRNIRMKLELDRVGIEAERFEAKKTENFKWDESKTRVMRNRTPGAIGCHYSQVAVMEEALNRGKNAGVFEDDLIFCSDIQNRLKHIEKFTMQREWDIIWLGGTYHKEPVDFAINGWHRSVKTIHTHPDMKNDCHCLLNKDWEPTDDPLMNRTYGCWSTYAYIVHFSSIRKILKLLDENVHRSMGIDWLFIKLQPQLKTFAFNPGCVKQYNNQSDIGNGITNFEGFNKLGQHWWKDRL